MCFLGHEEVQHITKINISVKTFDELHEGELSSVQKDFTWSLFGFVGN